MMALSSSARFGDAGEDPFGIGEEERLGRTQDEQAGVTFGFRVAIAAREIGGAGQTAQLGDSRAGQALQKREHGEGDGEQHAVQNAEQQHCQHGGAGHVSIPRKARAERAGRD